MSLVQEEQSVSKAKREEPMIYRVVKDMYEKIRNETRVDEYRVKMNEVMKKLTGEGCKDQEYKFDMHTGRASCEKAVNVDDEVIATIRDYLLKCVKKLEMYVVLTNYDIDRNDNVSDEVNVANLKKVVGDNFKSVVDKVATDMGVKKVYKIYIPLTREDDIRAYLMLRISQLNILVPRIIKEE